DPQPGAVKQEQQSANRVWLKQTRILIARVRSIDETPNFIISVDVGLKPLRTLRLCRRQGRMIDVVPGDGEAVEGRQHVVFAEPVHSDWSGSVEEPTHRIG